jgi:hypothetical protein
VGLIKHRAVVFARTNSSTLPLLRCSSNSSKKSASRSITHTCRVAGSAFCSLTQSRNPAIHAKVFFCSIGIAREDRAGAADFATGAVNCAFNTPSGKPSVLTTKVECRCSPEPLAPVWLAPITPNPLHCASAE